MERGNEECEFALLERQMEKAGKLCETERPNRLRISIVSHYIYLNYNLKLYIYFKV